MRNFCSHLTFLAYDLSGRTNGLPPPAGLRNCLPTIDHFVLPPPPYTASTSYPSADTMTSDLITPKETAERPDIGMTIPEALLPTMQDFILPPPPTSHRNSSNIPMSPLPLAGFPTLQDFILPSPSWLSPDPGNAVLPTGDLPPQQHAVGSDHEPDGILINGNFPSIGCHNNTRDLPHLADFLLPSPPIPSPQQLSPPAPCSLPSTLFPFRHKNTFMEAVRPSPPGTPTGTRDLPSLEDFFLPSPPSSTEGLNKIPLPSLRPQAPFLTDGLIL